MQTIIQNDKIKAIINHKGAELSSLEKNNENYIWEIDNQFWDKTSPVLFPVVGGLKEDHYKFEGKEYFLSRHGFAREREFQVVSETENSVVFSLKYDDKSLQIYPFEFELQMGYKIVDDRIFVQYRIANLGGFKMYYSIGAHPAFKIDGNFEDYSLGFDFNKTLVSHQLEDNLFSGKTNDIHLNDTLLPLNYELFENDAIVLKDSATQSLSLLYRGELRLKVEFSQFPYLGIWTKKDAPFICIEPWLGIADSREASGNIADKEGIQVLEPNSQNAFEWSVQLF